MNSKSLYIPRGWILVSLLTLISGAVAVFVSLAYAATVPSVTAVIQDESNATTTSAFVGVPIHLVANVASTTATTSPTGTVNFNRYDNTSCSGAAFEENNVALVDGVATSSVSALAITGYSYRVHYNGEDSEYEETDGQCIPVFALKYSSVINLSLSTTSVHVGANVFGSAQLTSATSTASGSIKYSVFSDNICSSGEVDAGSRTVLNSASSSDSLLFNVPGTFYWQAFYSGDENNNGATSTCGSILSVLATSTPATSSPPETPGSSSISGYVYNDQNKNDARDVGETGLSGWTLKLHEATLKKNGKWDYDDEHVVQTVVSDSNGYYVFSNLAAGTYIVEEMVMNGWKQTSDDPTIAIGTSTVAVFDFSNIEKSTNGNQNGYGKKDDDEDEDDDDSDGGRFWRGVTGKDNGWHKGWFKNGKIEKWMNGFKSKKEK